MLKGLITALVTPFCKNTEIDYPSLANLVKFQLDNGVSGLVVLGSTGEANSLSIAEKISLIEFVINKVEGKVKIIVGIPNNNLEDAKIFIDKFQMMVGIDYFMVATPSYIKPTQTGLYQYFSQLAICSKIPLILYNVPSRTCCDLLDDTVISLANDYVNIVGLKDATGNLARLCYLNKHRKQNFSLLSGDDETAMAFVLSGGDGIISVTSNIVPLIMSNMINAALNIEKDSAININNELIDIYRAMFVESNPIPIKWALSYKNIIETSELRLPLTNLNELHQNRLKALLK
jgi:4-hydroxy-tetrahydrodipicolinate synthase